jgi:hypothetical protein
MVAGGEAEAGEGNDFGNGVPNFADLTATTKFSRKMSLSVKAKDY